MQQPWLSSLLLILIERVPASARRNQSAACRAKARPNKCTACMFPIDSDLHCSVAGGCTFCPHPLIYMVCSRACRGSGRAPANAHGALIHRAWAPIGPHATNAGPGREDACHHLRKRALRHTLCIVAVAIALTDLHATFILATRTWWPVCSRHKKKYAHSVSTRPARLQRLAVQVCGGHAQLLGAAPKALHHRALLEGRSPQSLHMVTQHIHLGWTYLWEAIIQLGLQTVLHRANMAYGAWLSVQQQYLQQPGRLDGHHTVRQYICTLTAVVRPATYADQLLTSAVSIRSAHLQKAAGRSAQAGNRRGTAEPPRTLHDQGYLSSLVGNTHKATIVGSTVQANISIRSTSAARLTPHQGQLAGRRPGLAGWALLPPACLLLPLPAAHGRAG